MPRRPSLSCRQFRHQHVEYVDGLLIGDALQACEMHLEQCATCRQHDVRVRRSLMALQVLPRIEPSADFHRRLCDRLAHDTMHYTPTVAHRVRWGVAAAVLAASVALLIAAPTRPLGSHSAGVTMVQVPVLLGKSSPRNVASQQVAVIPAAYASVASVSAGSASPGSASPGSASPGSASPGSASAGSPLNAQSPKMRAPKNTASENGRTARFESVPGRAPLRTEPYGTRASSVRLQTVTYIGQ